MPKLPTTRFERACWAAGHRTVAGVDEAGRGALAGPLVAAALSLPPEPSRRAQLTKIIRQHGAEALESKLLTASKRELIYEILADQRIPFAVCEVEPEEVDRLGVGKANLLALRTAIATLEEPPTFALIDAFPVPDCCCDHLPIVKGDRRSISIALASIIAKVHRDRLMLQLHELYPDYGFDAHKGYGTRTHRDALLHFGPTPAHRRSFAPVSELVNNG